jgi:hypothetical protein
MISKNQNKFSLVICNEKFASVLHHVNGTVLSAYQLQSLAVLLRFVSGVSLALDTFPYQVTSVNPAAARRLLWKHLVAYCA